MKFIKKHTDCTTAVAWHCSIPTATHSTSNNTTVSSMSIWK